MSLSLEVLTSLIVACAPATAPETAVRLVRVESKGNPFAIGINGPYRLNAQPSNLEQALATARMALTLPKVKSIDVGLGQINSANFTRMGLTLESAFEPCKNLKAMEAHLLASYARAQKIHGPGQKALQVALSEYNTGHASKGIANGYVQKIYLQSVK